MLHNQKRYFAIVLLFLSALITFEIIYFLNGYEVVYYSRISDTYIFIAADDKFQEQNQLQIESIRCYAKKHSYTVIKSNLQENPKNNEATGEMNCCHNHTDFLFKRHCILACHMESLPQDAHVFLFDSDVMVGLAEDSLDHWKNDSFDLSFFERHYSGEITAGAYRVKNTLLARNFLKRWAKYEFSRPEGFNSADNGAIHVALLEIFGLGSTCIEDFHKLVADVSDLVPYFSFVSCARHALGMGSFEDGEDLGMGKFLEDSQEFRKNGVALDKRGGFSVKIYPRGYGWMLDYDDFNPRDLREKYWNEHRVVPVFSHNIKCYDTHEILKYWEIGSSKNTHLYWDWYTKSMKSKTDLTTEIFPLCQPRNNYGELPKQFEICVNETNKSDRKCIDSVVVSGGSEY
jgi:hypothetical protein